MVMTDADTKVRDVAFFAVSLVLCAVWAGSARAVPLTFTEFVNPHPTVTGGTIGFTFAGNKFVGTVQKNGTGALYSTDLSGGSVAAFAPSVSLLSNPASEHFVASSLGLGGFPSRDIYVANSNGVLHITNDGTSSNAFVTGLNGAVRGILFDAVGTFGNDMLITTQTGRVYRVTSAGTATLLANLGQDTEGLDVAPIGAGFGTHDGSLIVASEGSGQIRAITPGGAVTNLGVTIPGGPEMLSFVPLNLGASGSALEGFYAANYTPNVIKAAASEFTSLIGHAIVTAEFSHKVYDLRFDTAVSAFTFSQIGAFPNQPEDGIFVTQAIIQGGGGAPEPSTLALLGTALLGLGGYRRRGRVAS